MKNIEEHGMDTLSVEPFSRIGSAVEFLAPHAPDKSISHRAVMLAALARGTSMIRNPLLGEDCLATCVAFRKLGVTVEMVHHSEHTDLRIVSPGGAALKSPDELLFLGNSGTSARLLTGIFAGIPGLEMRLDGDESLRRRPMARVVEPLAQMGALIREDTPASTLPASSQAVTLPLTITGRKLRACRHVLKTPSAQIKSALLFAGIAAEGRTLIELPRGGRDHTEVMLASLGAPLYRRRYCDTEVIGVDGPWQPSSFECEVPQDPSSLAFFGALAALHPGMIVKSAKVLINPTRGEFFNVLREMGVTVEVKERSRTPEFMGEIIGDVRIYRDSHRELKPVVLGSERTRLMLDEIPILAVVCAFASGRSMLQGLDELRVKESNRLAIISQLLRAGGVKAEIYGDDLFVRGQESVSSIEFQSDDHRMLMSAIILATRGSAPSKVTGIKWIQTSFPLFISSFQSIKNILKK